MGLLRRTQGKGEEEARNERRVKAAEINEGIMTIIQLTRPCCAGICLL
jgi:hypothetical protein